MVTIEGGTIKVAESSDFVKSGVLIPATGMDGTLDRRFQEVECFGTQGVCRIGSHREDGRESNRREGPANRSVGLDGRCIGSTGPLTTQPSCTDGWAIPMSKASCWRKG
jgi:hypothetical protein